MTVVKSSIKTSKPNLAKNLKSSTKNKASFVDVFSDSQVISTVSKDQENSEEYLDSNCDEEYEESQDPK